MVINRIHINRFGALREKEITLGTGTGLNIIEGENESGKTTIAAFLGFLFYGLLNRDTVSGPVSGWADITCAQTYGIEIPPENDDGDNPAPAKQFRIERVSDGRMGADDFSAVYAIRDGAVDRQSLFCVGRAPGEVFFGVPAAVFASTAMVTQVSAAQRGAEHSDTVSSTGGSTTSVYGSPTDTDAVRAAMERILYAADEELDPKGAAQYLTEKRNALYDPETGRGTIAELERRRDALASALEQETETAETVSPDTDTQETPLPAEAAPETHPDNGAVPELDEATAAEIAALEESAAALGENKRQKEQRTSQLEQVYAQYKEYQSMQDTDVLPELLTRQAAAEKRADALTKTMFRGNYVPDADYAASLHLCASDLAAAKTDMDAAHADEDKLAFSVRRDNFKENQLRRVALDGGADAVLAKLDRIAGRRSAVTVFGILFLVFTVFALAVTVFMLVLHAASAKNIIFLTALLGALAGFFFFSRARYEKSIGVMLTRYSCSTEDELENFLEEFMLTEEKLHTLDENKEELSRRVSEASLRASEAGRQAALLLSKLQPPGAQKLTADRLTPEIIETAAQRIDRTLAEISRQRETADVCRAEIETVLSAHNAQNAKELLARREALEKMFAGGTGEDGTTTTFRPEPIVRELDFNLKSCAAIDAKLSEIHAKIETLRNPPTAADTGSANGLQAEVPPVSVETVGGSAAQKAAAGLRRAMAGDCLPDAALLRSLLSEMDARLREERKQYAAYTLAAATMQRASARLHKELAPTLTANAGRMMRLLSGDRWGELSFDESMRLTAAAGKPDNGEGLALDCLSAGTQELAYLSLRMALVQMLYKKELPPLIFDEAFATLDDKRLARMIALLLRQTGGDAGQALVFTCHKRERRAAEAIGKCNVIRI